MRIKPILLFSCLLAALSFVFISQRSAGQSTGTPSLITQPIDESKLVVLTGNTHPLARAKYDQGPAPSSLAMDRMMLVLKTTATQGAALQSLLAQQQDRSSANYHKWLTPQEFGAQFGVSDADIQKITSWLQSQGFQVDSVANGRNVIQFSGNAAQVQTAFHTTIHKYAVNGKENWANSSDPSIPAALTPAVAGVASLNNFPKKAAHRLGGTVTRDVATGKLKAVKPQFTYPAGCQGTTGSECYGVTPTDFATIYNILPLWNAGITGAGETIAIISDSDVNPADLTNFRSLFGLPAVNFQRTYTPGSSSSNPGIQACDADALPTSNGNECEAALDVQWSGAVAPGATINLVISADTATSFGGDISAQYIIDNNLAKIIGYSYGECELGLGTAGNAFYGGSPTVKDSVGEWAQAAAEGITVVVSTGDSGSTGCDSDSDGELGAEFGLAVNGVASTPYNVAIGGTDFNDATNPTTYWNSSNPSTTTEASVKGYIPEVTYNDTCTNSIIETIIGLGGNIETDCNELITNSNLNFLLEPAGGGGGVSACTTSNGETPSSCSGGYPKPSWQTALTVNDGKRDLPDFAIFAGDGTLQNFYLYCQADNDPSNAACSLTPGSSTSPYPDILMVGGTSVSTEVFAGMVALLNQSTGSAQGLVNTNLYALAGQSWANCQSNGAQTSACIFNQVTSGTIAMPCNAAQTVADNATGCTVANNGDVIAQTTQANGALAYNAGPGYNLATGLGSLNVDSLVNQWNVGSGGAADFVISSSPAAVTVSTAGGTGNTVLTIVPLNNFNDTVAFSASSCSGLPTGATCNFSASPVSANGTTSLTITTAAAATAPPAVRPLGSGRWTVGTIASLACALAIAIILLITRSKNRRWSTAAACAVFLLTVGIAACGGGGSSSSGGGGGGGGGGSTTTVVEPVAVTITGTSTTGKVSHTTSVMLTAE
jgi:subtilase family serine protease